VSELLVSSSVSRQLFEECSFIDIGDCIIMLLLTIDTSKLPHIVLLCRDLSFVIQLSVGDHIAFGIRLLPELLSEFLCLVGHVPALILLLSAADFTLTFNMLHLVLQVVLHLLILAESHHLFMISLNSVLPCIVIDNLAPESALLFVLHSA